MIRVGDDIGAQQAMMMSPKSWRELAKPRFKWMLEQFKQENPRSSSSSIRAATTRRSWATRWISASDLSGTDAAGRRA
jgi:hypothetical protein